MRLGAGLRARRTGDVAASVRAIVDDAAYGDRARALSADLLVEDGPETAADAVEDVLRETSNL